jgi:hypothetical protein
MVTEKLYDDMITKDDNPINTNGKITVTSVKLTGQGGILKCDIHSFSTDNPVSFHAHLLTTGHTESGSRPCEYPGCTRIAHFSNKPMRERSYCSTCNSRLEGGSL